MFGVTVDMIPKVDRAHPVVNMNEPLIPHDSGFFKLRGVRDDKAFADAKRKAMHRFFDGPRFARRNHGDE
jgi:hypothetical protein